VSALPPEADIRRRIEHVRYVPEADICLQIRTLEPRLMDGRVIVHDCANISHPKQVLELEEVVMTHESRRLAGILLIVLPTVMFGGLSTLSLLIGERTFGGRPK